MNPIPAPESSPDNIRRIYADGIEWEIYEQDTTRTPGATDSTSLIFSSPELVRRVWRYPADWLQLSDGDLLTLRGDVTRDFYGRDGETARRRDGDDGDDATR